MIVGPGAMGILFGSKLCIAGFPVSFQIKSQDKLSPYQEEGVILREGSEEINVRPHFFKCGSPPPFLPQFVLISVKAYHTKEALKPLVGFLSEDTTYITIQNGLKPLKDIKKLVRPEDIVLGVTTEGATRISRFTSERRGIGVTFLFSPYDSKSEKPERIMEILRESGLRAEVPANGWDIFWQKLLVSLSVNPITALLGVKNGELFGNNWGIDLIKLIVKEAISVIGRLGTSLDYQEAVDFVFKTIKRTSENRSSMLQDIESQRQTEIEAISGEFIRKARHLGIGIPAIETLYKLLLLKERSLGIQSF